MDTAPTNLGDDPLAALLEEWGKAEQAATKGPWSVTQRHGTDIAGEAWSEVKITAPGGGDIAATFISHVLENYHDGDDTDFIVTARTAMPRLLGAVTAALELPAEWEGAAASADRTADRRAGLPSAASLTDCARQLREAITRELTGKEPE